MAAVVHSTLNRTRQSVFLDSLAARIESAGRGGHGFGLVLLSIRNFDELNLSLGYAGVDGVLAGLAARLDEAFRNKAPCLRVGTKTFALVLERVSAPAFALLAASKAERLVRGMPAAGGGIPIKLEPAVGAALYPDHAVTAEALLQAAESALRESRQTRRITLYDADDTGRLRALHHAEVALKHALEHGGIEVFFQPQIGCATGELIGAEALLRCRDADGSYLSSELVVQAASRAGLMTEVSRAVLNTALRYAAEWPVPNARVSLNVSPESLNDSDFIDSIPSAARIWDRRPETLTLEVTESAFMEDPEASAPVMRRLRDEGMRVAIDDFGTGYSSFAYFKDIPAHELKIDKSFVQNLPRSDADRRIVRAIVSLAHEFDLEVVAEGVESGGCLEMLHACGCDIAQGFWVGRPMAAATFREWLAARGRSGEPAAADGPR